MSGFVDLNNPGAVPNPVQTMQSVAVSTPSFTGSISLSDTNVDISGSASASQNSAANGTTISVGESAAASADLSLCPGSTCTAFNQGSTEFDAMFCIGSATTYSLTGSVQASASEDLGNITATGAVSLATVGSPPMFIVVEEATDGQNVPISMSLPLAAGCYEIDVKVFALAQPSGTGSGSASSSSHVLLSPQ